MSPSDLFPGDVVYASFPEHQPPGREQQGRRPAVVLAIPVPPVRFPVLFVVPLTTRVGSWQAGNPKLYPKIPAGSGNLPRESVALLDQARALDRGRVVGYLGTLSDQTFSPILDGLFTLCRPSAPLQ